MKLSTMNPCAASFGSRPGNWLMYCSIWPICAGSSSFVSRSATMPVGMEAKISAGKTTAPRRSRLANRSRASLLTTAQMNPGRTQATASPMPLPSLAPTLSRSRTATSPTMSR